MGDDKDNGKKNAKAFGDKYALQKQLRDARNLRTGSPWDKGKDSKT